MGSRAYSTISSRYDAELQCKSLLVQCFNFDKTSDLAYHWQHMRQHTCGMADGVDSTTNSLQCAMLWPVISSTDGSICRWVVP